MLTMTEAHPVRRSAGKGKAPCFVLLTKGNHVSQSEEVTMTDLKHRADGVINAAEEIKNVAITFLKLKSHTSIPTGSFLQTREFTAIEENSNNFIAALKGQNSLLSKLVNYTEYARTHGKIGKEHGPNSLKAKLHGIENQLYQIMCDIKIALLGKGGDTNIIPNAEVSPAFKDAARTYEKEVIRAYVLMNDFQATMKFLKKMYK